MANVIREYPVRWGYLSNVLMVPALAAAVDVIVTRVETGEIPNASMATAAGMAALLAVLRAAQHYWKSKDPGLAPTVYTVA